MSAGSARARSPSNPPSRPQPYGIPSFPDRPLAPDATGRERDVVQALALTALRALGVADARARGIVVQTALPAAAGAPSP